MGIMRKLFLLLLIAACAQVSAFIFPSSRLSGISSPPPPALEMRYVAMNRFKVKLGCEDQFEKIWRERESKLQEYSGFMQFMMLKEDKGTEETEETEEKMGGCTNFISFSVWMHKLDFLDWKRSQAFKASHSSGGPVVPGGMSKMGELLEGRPQPEMFDAVLVEPTPAELQGELWDIEDEPSYFDGDL
ncbi:unnamed protein product [Choristocarpus tenellus]